jgi:prolipoprotein diacylglyceryltransferase
MLPPKFSFRICGIAGLILGGPLAIALAVLRGLSPLIEILLVIVAVGMLLATPLAVKVFTGIDGFVFYRDVLCIFAAVAITLRLVHQPLLPYLDVTVAGAGVFHACGRIGCLFAGCCYGRPCRLGVCYKHEHVAMGFPAQLAGVPLFPIQLIESAWILCLITVASHLVLRNQKPGTAFAIYVSGYALGRFFCEFFRGDADRPYWRGFSQAQWISPLLTFGIVVLERFGAIPHATQAYWIFTAIAVSIVAIAVRRELGFRRFDLLHPRHIHQLAKTLSLLKPHQFAGVSGSQTIAIHPKIATCFTPLGIGISASEFGNHHDEREWSCVNPQSHHLEKHERYVRHYCLSLPSEYSSPSIARLLARQISRLHCQSQKFELLAGSSGTFHVFFPCKP